jgi:hypothetical protein
MAPFSRIPLTHKQQTAIEIEQIDESLEWIQLELLDIFADVENPAGSDNEPEEENLNLSQNERTHQLCS